MELLPIKKPELNRPVKAIIKHFNHWQLHVARMIAVDEDDCDWRTVDDNSELSYEWNVVYWEYMDGNDDVV